MLGAFAFYPPWAVRSEINTDYRSIHPRSMSESRNDEQLMVRRDLKIAAANRRRQKLSRPNLCLPVSPRPIPK